LEVPVTVSIAPDVFRISTFVPDFNLVYQFLVRDDEPLLVHTGPTRDVCRGP
jgi:hypothetical protein